MLSSVYLKTVRDYRKFLIWMSVGIVAMSLYLTSLYPVIADATEILDFWEQMPDAIKALVGSALDLGTPEGFLNAEIFAVMGLIIFAVYGVTRGSGAVAGEEEARTLDQLLANPISRRRVYGQKWLAMVTGAALLCLVLWAILLGGMAATGNTPSVAKLTAACFSAFLFTVATGSIALAIGAATGRKGAASGITTGILVIGYLVNSFKTLVDFLEPARFVSVIYYYNGNEVILHGLVAGHVGALVVIAVAAFAIGLYYFERRDLA